MAYLNHDVIAGGVRMFRNVKKHEKKSFSIRKKLILSYVLLVFISLVLYFFLITGIPAVI